MNKKTKIVCTLGPASNSLDKIVELIKAGMNVARLNFSHGDYESHSSLISNIRKAEKETGTRIAIIQDLQGPKIRVGKMPEKGVLVKKNEVIKLTIKKIEGGKTNGEAVIPVQYKNITKDVDVGDLVLINDGLVETKAIKVTPQNIFCKVKFGGYINSGNGVNLPSSDVSIKTITPKDKKDLQFGLKNKVDFVALSFVKSGEDIKELRKLMEKNGGTAKIIAKIERHEAVSNLKEIIKHSDGAMVARGDLGTDIPAEYVPIVQKRIISLSNSMGKPVITATQVLQSMVNKSRPTRAEISDAANAVFDHTDAIMLSNETAVGKYPRKAVTTLTKVANTIEKELKKHKELQEYIINKHYMSPINATCLNACELAMDSDADAIVVYTEDGYTANHIAKHRIYKPVITITPHERIAHSLILTWGINDFFVEKLPADNSKKMKEILRIVKKEKFVKRGDKIVFVCNAKKEKGLISIVQI